jgi:hypothetical protein
MSHWCKCRTKLNDKEFITKALTRLGYTYQEGSFTIKEYGKSEDAQIKLDESLGLSQQKDGTWAFVGDPYHCKTQQLRKYYGKITKLKEEVSTAYAIEETKDVLAEQRFFCTENEEANIGEDGMITMVYEQLG